MRKILVPTDFSELAENALKVAAQLARKYTSEIYLLHMLELPTEMANPVGDTRTSDLPEALYYMKLAKKRFSEILSQPYLEGLTVHETVQFHAAFEGIMDKSKECDCDIIVMGSHGSSGFKEIFVGSNTEKVVRTSHIPVLVIKNEYLDFKVEDFIFASDGSIDSKHTLKKALKFAEKIEANLHLLYVNTPNKFITSEQAEEKMKEFIKGSTLREDQIHIYNDSSVEKGIFNYAKQINAGLIGISTHGKKGLAHFFNGSISEDLVNHAQRPVVTFKI